MANPNDQGFASGQRKPILVEYPLHEKGVRDLQHAMYTAYHEGVQKDFYIEAGNGSDFTFDKTRITAKKIGEVFRPKDADFNTKMTAITLPIPYADFATKEQEDIAKYKEMGGRVEKSAQNTTTIVIPDHKIDDFIRAQISRENNKVPRQRHHYSGEAAGKFVSSTELVEGNGWISVVSSSDYILHGGEHQGAHIKVTEELGSIDLRIHTNVIPKLNHQGIQQGQTYTASDPQMREIVDAATTAIVKDQPATRRMTLEEQLRKSATPAEIVKRAKESMGIHPIDGIIDRQFTAALRGHLEKIQATQVVGDMAEALSEPLPLTDYQSRRNADGYTTTSYQTKLTNEDQNSLRRKMAEKLEKNPTIEKYLNISITPGRREEIPAPDKEPVRYATATPAPAAPTHSGSPEAAATPPRQTNAAESARTTIAFSGEHVGDPARPNVPNNLRSRGGESMSV